MTLNGHDSISFLTVVSSNLLPISRLYIVRRYRSTRRVLPMEGSYLTSKIVFAGFIAAWFLAASPINLSSSVNETNEGVV